MNTQKKITIIIEDYTEEVARDLNKFFEDKGYTVTEPTPSSNKVITVNDVAEQLIKLGVPTHIKGYDYIKDAIMLSLKDKDMLRNITKALYPDIAKHYNTTPLRVERAIRHAIEVTWLRGASDILNEYFGNTIDCTKGKATNSQFISTIVERLILEFTKN